MHHGFDIRDLRDQPVLLVEQTRNTGQDNEQVGFREDRDLRRKPVVVPKPEFFDCNRVIFIDNRHHRSEPEEPFQSVPCILIPRPAIDILMAQQKLGHMKSVPLKECLILAHKPRLTNRCTSLNRGKIAWPFPDSHQSQPGANRATADEEALMACLYQLGNFSRQTPQLRRVQRIAGGLCKDSGSKFDNDALPLIRHTKAVYIVTS
jgi:hypothetical protein